jgi:hypothetical protein
MYKISLILQVQRLIACKGSSDFTDKTISKGEEAAANHLFCRIRCGQNLHVFYQHRQRTLSRGEAQIHHTRKRFHYNKNDCSRGQFK